MYLYIHPESHHQTLHTKRPPSPFRPLGHGVDANTKFNTRRTNTGELEKRKGKGKEEKKDTKHCIFVCNFVDVFFLVIFPFFFFHFNKFFVKKT